jgi:hypothetical protein
MVTAEPKQGLSWQAKSARYSKNYQEMGEIVTLQIVKIAEAFQHQSGAWLRFSSSNTQLESIAIDF